MSSENLIKDTLETTGYLAFNGFTKTSKRVYFIFDIDTEPSHYADDVPLCEDEYITIHLFCENSFDPVALVEDAKRALFKAGFSYPEKTALTSSNTGYGEVSDMRHILLGCERRVFIKID